MLPLSKNPPSRFPQRKIADATEPWWIAKVKPRQEKALAFDLLEKKIEYYLPMYTKVVRRKDNNKPRKSIICLFSGYLSYCSLEGYERDIYKTNRIVNVIKIKNQKKFIRELEQIYLSIEHGVTLEPINPVDYKPGEKVKVTSGPLKGITGTVLKKQAGQKLILSVDVLGKAAVSIDSSLLQIIE